MGRRDFLRTAVGGAAALGTGAFLAEPAAAQAAPLRLFVSTFLGASVIELLINPDGTVSQKEFAKFGKDARNRTETTAGIVVTGDNVFVFSPGSDQIFMLDRTTGARKKTLAGPFITTAHDGAIGPDGLLYVVNAPSIAAIPGTARADSIERFDPVTGDHVDTFANSNTNAPARAPFGLVWGPDGDLYVASVTSYGFNPQSFPYRSDHVTRFDGRTGQFKGFVVRETHITFTMRFHPSGRLLIPAHFFNRIYAYDINDSRQLEAFIDVDLPLGLAYGPDGDLYVASLSKLSLLDPLLDADTANDNQAFGNGAVLRYDGRTGKLKRTIVRGLPFGGFLAFA